jgi:hypothetical protein
MYLCGRPFICRILSALCLAAAAAVVVCVDKGRHWYLRLCAYQNGPYLRYATLNSNRLDISEQGMVSSMMTDA